MDINEIVVTSLTKNPVQQDWMEKILNLYDGEVDDSYDIANFIAVLTKLHSEISNRFREAYPGLDTDKYVLQAMVDWPKTPCPICGKKQPFDEPLCTIEDNCLNIPKVKIETRTLTIATKVEPGTRTEISNVRIADLIPGKYYVEDLIDDNEDKGAATVAFIFHNSGKQLAVYLAGYYPISERGKQKLLEWGKRDDLVDYMNSDEFEIGIEDYRDSDHFFEKWGFHDEGIIIYDSLLDEFTVESEFVGKIRFYKDPTEVNSNLTIKKKHAFIYVELRDLDHSFLGAYPKEGTLLVYGTEKQIEEKANVFFRRIIEEKLDEIAENYGIEGLTFERFEEEVNGSDRESWELVIEYTNEPIAL